MASSKQPNELGTAEVPLMEFVGKDGKPYRIVQTMSVSYKAFRNGKLVLGHPDLKMMLKQIAEGKTGE